MGLNSSEGQLFSQVKPVFSTQGAIRYLSSGVISHIGPALASRIVNHFKEDTFKILDSDPSRLSEISGISGKTLEEIIISWGESRNRSDDIIELYGLGLTVAYAKKVFNHFGKQSKQIIKQNPYKLTEVHGIGFKKADEIAFEQGITKDNPFRIESCILFTLDQASKIGDCYLPKKKLIEASSKNLEITDLRAIEVVLSDMNNKLMVTEDGYYLPHLYNAEKIVAKTLNNLAYIQPRDLTQKEKGTFEKISGYLTEKQKEAVKRSLRSRLSVITGLPGTGKTTIIKTLVEILKASDRRFKLCAPTGKAAKRLYESSGEEVTTIHRLLEYKPITGFSKNKNNPLNTEYLIIDETSMIDILLMKSVMDALAPEASLVMVGDADQLPSVGPGNILHEIVEKQAVPITKLTEIHRQAEGSNIIRIAHSINAGVKPTFRSGEDACFIKEDDPIKITEAIISEALNSGFSLAETQVLTPMKKNSLGSGDLNKLMQMKLNKVNAKENISGFFLNDRVIQRVNNYIKNVFNGEVGYVIDIDAGNKRLTVDYGDKTIGYEAYDIDEIELAYALTIHKAQGSQFPCVILPIHTQHYMMLKRQILYTAVTRAEKKIIIIGSDKAMYMAVTNNQERLRYTKLF